MFNTKHADIINEQRGIIVHGVNCQGVMGSGLALQVKKTYPEAFKDYINVCNSYRNKSLLLGRASLTMIRWELFIVNGFTQLNYGRDGNVVYVDYNAVKKVFETVNKLALETKLPVLFPKIGAGLANGDWNIISEIIDTTLVPEVSKTLFVI